LWFANVARASVLSESTVTDAGLFPGGTNAWHILGETYSEANGFRLYTGQFTSAAPLAEVSYTSAVVGSGDTTADSGDLYIGNRGAVPFAISWDIARVAMFDAELALSQLQRLHRSTLSQWAAHPNAVFVHDYHASGATQPDWSRNARTGAVTGATIIDHAPIPMFAVDEDDDVPYSVVVATAAVVRVMFNKLRPRIFAPGLAR
jgi:hypothetical protein